VKAFLELGRDHPKLTVGTGEVVLSMYRTRTAMIEAGQHICSDRIALFSFRPAVSIAIDAGTIKSRHFLDIMLLAPYTGLKPFLYTAVEQTRLTAEDYGSIVAKTICDPKQAKVDVRSIVGDNLPTQISALAHWSTRSCLRGQEAFLDRIKYSPCLCHVMQLVLGDTISKLPLVSDLDFILHKMIEIAHYSEVRTILKGCCPYSVKTRWFSRCKVLDRLFNGKLFYCTESNLTRRPKSGRQLFETL
jgi:hypothetical protein